MFTKVSKLFAVSAEKGARTSIFLASSPDVASVSGRYFVKCRPAESFELSQEEAYAERLWQASTELCGRHLP